VTKTKLCNEVFNVVKNHTLVELWISYIRGLCILVRRVYLWNHLHTAVLANNVGLHLAHTATSSQEHFSYWSHSIYSMTKISTVKRYTLWYLLMITTEICWMCVGKQVSGARKLHWIPWQSLKIKWLENNKQCWWIARSIWDVLQRSWCCILKNPPKTYQMSDLVARMMMLRVVAMQLTVNVQVRAIIGHMMTLRTHLICH
jgi:hypothetical protein